ncbi:MAG: UDP-N-acetylmuramoyl-tripeptide--D-alanyl-D-alanine ligase [Bacteroidales bacterium]
MEFNRKNNELSIEDIYKIYLENPNITTDSRSPINNSIFFALKGENFNGNGFALNALENGASYSIIDEKEYYIDSRTILVDNVLNTLQNLALYHRRQFPKLKLIAITGTNGKTTTKELSYAVLSQNYNCIATQGNFNNHIGLPLTLLRINKDTEIAIIEMGANHIGEIDKLCRIAQPEYGLITNIGKAHLEGFLSFENIVKTKTELFRYLDKKDHYPIINMDDSSLENYSKTHRNKAYTYRTKGIFDYDTACIEFENNIVNSNLIGHYNNQNLMAAMTLGSIFSVETSKSIKAINEFYPSNHRSQIKKTDNNTLILDCYNANPTSVELAILEFRNKKNLDKVLCLGAMRELGKDSKSEHNRIIEIIKGIGFNSVFFVGEEFKETNYHEINNAKWFETSKELKKYLVNNPIKESKILIKGSRTTKMEEIEDAL